VVPYKGGDEEVAVIITILHSDDGFLRGSSTRCL